MSVIVSSYQHCDEQEFQTLSRVHYTIFSVVKLDLSIRALLLDHILLWKKYAYASRASCYNKLLSTTCMSNKILQYHITIKKKVKASKY